MNELTTIEPLYFTRKGGPFRDGIVYFRSYHSFGSVVGVRADGSQEVKGLRRISRDAALAAVQRGEWDEITAADAARLLEDQA